MKNYVKFENRLNQSEYEFVKYCANTICDYFGQYKYLNPQMIVDKCEKASDILPIMERFYNGYYRQTEQLLEELGYILQ